MSQLLIQKYLNDLETLRRASGTNRESVVRRAFERLLEEWGKSRGLVLIPEWEHRTAMDERRVVDGALVELQLRLPFGYWEAKDTNDDLEQEIAKKLRRGYPRRRGPDVIEMERCWKITHESCAIRPRHR